MLKLLPARPPVLNERYEILGVIDVFGGVHSYLAWDDADETWCTVQVLGFKHALDPLARSRFQRSIDSLQRLDHPNVLKIIEAEADHAVYPYAVLEVTEAGTVADWLGSHGAMPAYLAIDVMGQVCGAISAAHRAGFSHGNLRPDQIQIDRLGGCKVIGFRGGGDRPELLQDIRSAGSMMYTLLTGRAFDESRADQLIGSLNPAIGRAVGMTRKTRGGYADILTFSRDLEAAVLELPAPSAHVPPLAPADCALPDDPAAVWDDQTRFDDLLWLTRREEDPSYQPTQQEMDLASGKAAAGSSTTESSGSGAAAMAAEPAPVEASPQAKTDRSMSAIPYVMASPSDAASDDDGPGYTFEEPKERENWDNSWQADFEAKEAGPSTPELTNEQRTDLLLTRAVAGGVVFLILVLLGAFGYGMKLVSAAQSEAEDAGKVLVAAVDRESKLIYDMAAVGADKNALEASYFVFSDAKVLSQQIKAASHFARVVDQQAKKTGLDPISAAGSGGELTGRIDSLGKAHVQYVSKWSVWSQRAGSFPGILPVIFGIRDRPE